MQIYQHVKMSQNTCTGINLVRNRYCMDTAGKKPEALFHYAKSFLSMYVVFVIILSCHLQYQKS